MRAAAIFVAFFLLFTSVSLAVPVPLFPGSVVEKWFIIPYISAVANGITYGLIVWIVFFFVNRRLEKASN